MRRAPSLALRAGLIFVSIYAISFATFLVVTAISNAAESGGNRHRGAYLALGYAAEEIRQVDNKLVLSSAGKFRNLAARNPSLWLLGQSGGRSISFGPVPATTIRLFEQYKDIVSSVRFEVANADPSLRGAVIRTYHLGGEPMLLAAGGVDPMSLTARESFPITGPGGLGFLIAIALLGFVAMLIALPLFSRAIRPITAEAGALHPQDSERRLDERKAPRELLPLVRAFNAALDRLAFELGRRKRFVADVAHELRTPLAVVSLRVEALKDKAAREELRNGMNRLTHLVSQMLDLERLSLAGRQRASIDLTAVARDVVADLAPMALKAGYDLSLDAPARPVTVKADRHAIERAITNLIVNSIAHAGGKGDIHVMVGADRAIDVVDEGPGVPASVRPRLFEPFCRESPNSESCGLGLHLTREIMRAHGGDVRLLPSERGATFRLEFPSPRRKGRSRKQEDASGPN